MIGDVVGALQVDDVTHDVVDETVHHYRRWRLACAYDLHAENKPWQVPVDQNVTWIATGTPLEDTRRTDCVACLARRR